MQCGKATTEATKIYTETKDMPNSILGKTGLSVSQIGYGAYRVEAHEDAHYDAMTKAFQNGFNLVDTSANYTDGRSEELVGVVIDDLIDAKDIRRENIVVVTKGGYIQGENLTISRKQQSEGIAWDDLVPYSDHLEHCIHPDFLKDQIYRSLSNMGLDCIDVYMLHNPEYFLDWARKEGLDLIKSREIMYKRIKDAFVFLEQEVSAGRIAWYGVSANTFIAPSNDFAFLSAKKLLEIANEVSENHHFAVIEFPVNLMESHAVTLKNQDEESLLQWAVKNNMGVLVNRPLNALRADAMIRLVDVEERGLASEGEIISAIKAVTDEENELLQRYIKPMKLAESVEKQVVEMISVGRDLSQIWKNFASWDQWRWSQEQFFMQRAQNAIKFLLNQLGDTVDLRQDLEHFVATLSSALEAVDSVYRIKGADDINKLKDAVAKADKDWSVNINMSQLAVRALRSTFGIHTVLVGMRNVKYVDDMLEEVKVLIDPKDRSVSWQQLDENLEAIQKNSAHK